MEATATKIWTKTEIREKLATDQAWLERGLVALYRKQTPEEQLAEMTVEDNSVGFNGLDAEFLTSIARQIIDGRHLSQKQVDSSRKAMLKYAGQLADIANGRR